MTKVQIAAPASQKEKVLQFLQEEELVHVAEEITDNEAVATQTAYFLASIQFALEFFKTVRKRLHIIQKRSLKNLFVSKPAATLPELMKTLNEISLEPILVSAQQQNDLLNEKDAYVKQLEDRIAQLTPWAALALRGSDVQASSPIEHVLLSITTHDESSVHSIINRIPTSLWQQIHREELERGIQIYGELVLHRQDTQYINDILEVPGVERILIDLGHNETVSDRLVTLQQELALAQAAITQTLEQATRLLQKERELQFAYDALLHQQDREEKSRFITHLPRSFVLTGWMPTKAVAHLRSQAEKFALAIAVEEIPAGSEDRPPVALVNNKLLEPFEAVTNVYGKPAYNEIDPSPALSLFFLVAFGLALTDAGYGLIMVIIMAVAEKFFRLKREMRKMVRLLMYAGATTVVLGALTGGWFGIVLEELPSSVVKDALLAIKLIDPVTNPIGLLLVAFAIGIVQLISAWGVRGYYHWKIGSKKEILLDDVPWMTIVPLLLAWVGAGQGVLPPSTEILFKWLLIANVAFLVITQGRSSKNPFLKLGVGALSLYGLVGFLSDTLSYSRLLALGLATGIIGLVVNLIASMVSDSIPVIGVALAAIVLVIGHVFNLGINALGAFIHSSRLQFVEFFPKFMEGGGVPYRPLGRVSRYVDNPREFT